MDPGVQTKTNKQANDVISISTRESSEVFYPKVVLINQLCLEILTQYHLACSLKCIKSIRQRDT